MRAWLPRVVALSLLVIGAIHLMPVLGVLGAPRLSDLYGIDASDPNVAILMRHRAVLFGLLGAYFTCAAFHRRLQPTAFVGAGLSLVAFLVLAWTTGGYNALVARVVVADLIALAALVVGVLAWLAARGHD